MAGALRSLSEMGDGREGAAAARRRRGGGAAAAKRRLLTRSACETTKERQAAPSSRLWRRDSQPPDHLLRCSAEASSALLGRYVVERRISTSPVTVPVYPIRSLCDRERTIGRALRPVVSLVLQPGPQTFRGDGRHQRRHVVAPAAALLDRIEVHPDSKVLVRTTCAGHAHVGRDTGFAARHLFVAHED